MKCPACQTSLVDDAKFCLKCGQQIPRCPTCGEAILTRCKFCGKDGTAVPQELQDLLPDAPAAFVLEPQRSFCVKCGKEISLGRKLCGACASKEGNRVSRHKSQNASDDKQKILILVIAVVAVVVLLLACVTCAIAVRRSIFKGKDSQTVSQVGSGWLQTGDEKPEPATLPAVTEPPATAAPTQAPTEPTEPPTEAPTEAPTKPAPNIDSRLLYVIENCDSMYLTESDLSGFDKEMCRIARNALYAKSGRKFNDASLQDFFEQFDWYHPTVEPSAFSGSMFNKYQSANLNLISNYEHERGYR